jgi:hypothetical protein
MGIKPIKEPIETLDFGILHITNLNCACWGDPVFVTSIDLFWWEVNGFWGKSLLGFSKEKCNYGYYTDITLKFLGFKYVIRRKKEDEHPNL